MQTVSKRSGEISPLWALTIVPITVFMLLTVVLVFGGDDEEPGVESAAPVEEVEPAVPVETPRDAPVESDHFTTPVESSASEPTNDETWHAYGAGEGVAFTAPDGSFSVTLPTEPLVMPITETEANFGGVRYSARVGIEGGAAVAKWEWPAASSPYPAYVDFEQDARVNCTDLDGVVSDEVSGELPAGGYFHESTCTFDDYAHVVSRTRYLTAGDVTYVLEVWSARERLAEFALLLESLVITAN